MKLAKITSYLLHPLLMPTLALYVLFQADTFVRFSTTMEQRTMIYIMVFTNTFVLPLIVSFLLYKNRQIKSLEMETTNERILPLLMTFVFYVSTFFLLKNSGLSYLIYSSFLAATLTVFLVLLIYILLKWKISAHMAGIGGVIGAIIAFSIQLSANMVLALLLSILAAGILGYARMKLQAHSPSQVYSGFFIGLSTQLILVL